MAEITNFINVADLTYCGKEAQEIFSKQVYNLDLRSYGITLMDNVKGKQKIYTGEIGDAWQEYTCPFTPSGAASLAEAFIEPVRIKVNMENCYDSWDNSYLVEQTSIAMDGGIPQTFSEWFFNEKLLPKMDKEYQEIFWQGDTEYSGTKKYLKVTDGIEKQIKAAEGVELIEAAALTVDNVISQVEAVVMKALEKAATEEVPTDDYKIFMNYADVKLLEVALGKETAGNLTVSIFKNYSKNGNTINVMGFDIVPTMQTRNTIIMGPVKNLVLGFDTFDSHLEYRLIDMRETTGDNAFRVLALSNIAVGIILPELFVYSYKGA